MSDLVAVAALAVSFTGLFGLIALCDALRR
jgi:hypothetical protein